MFFSSSFKEEKNIFSPFELGFQLLAQGCSYAEAQEVLYYFQLETEPQLSPQLREIRYTLLDAEPAKVADLQQRSDEELLKQIKKSDDELFELQKKSDKELSKLIEVLRHPNKELFYLLKESDQNLLLPLKISDESLLKKSDEELLNLLKQAEEKLLLSEKTMLDEITNPSKRHNLTVFYFQLGCDYLSKSFEEISTLPERAIFLKLAIAWLKKAAEKNYLPAIKLLQLKFITHKWIIPKKVEELKKSLESIPEIAEKTFLEKAIAFGKGPALFELGNEIVKNARFFPETKKALHYWISVIESFLLKSIYLGSVLEVYKDLYSFVENETPDSIKKWLSGKDKDTIFSIPNSVILKQELMLLKFAVACALLLRWDGLEKNILLKHLAIEYLQEASLENYGPAKQLLYRINEENVAAISSAKKEVQLPSSHQQEKSNITRNKYCRSCF